MRRSMLRMVVAGAICLAASQGDPEANAYEDQSRDVGFLISKLDDKEPYLRRQAALFLGNLGSEAKRAAPALQKGLDDSEVEVRAEVEARTSAAKALGELGTMANEAAPELLRESFRAHKGKIINHTVLASEEALPRIVPDLAPMLLQAFDWPGRPGDEEQEVGGVPEETAQMWREQRLDQFHLHIIYRLQKLATPVVPRVIEALDDEKATVRRGAAKTLAALGPSASEAEKPLTAARGDDDALVRIYAADALFRVTGDAEAGLATLVAALGDESPRTRRIACEKLGAMGPAAHGAIPSLCEALADEAHFAAAEALVSIGEEAIAPLIESLGDERPRVRRAAASVVARTGANVRDVGPPLERLLGDENQEVRESAARAFWHLGAPAASYWPAIVRALNDDRLSTETACDVLRTMGPAAAEAAPTILEIFASAPDETSEYAMRAAAAALASVAPERTPEAVDLLLKRMARPETLIPAISALGAIGPAASGATTQLAQTLIDESAEQIRIPNRNLYVRVCRIFENLGPQAGAAGPTLLRIADSQRPEHARNLAIRALGRLGEAAAPSLAGLENLAADETVAPRIRDSATASALAIRKAIAENPSAE
jgi:HEAT repeat protein